MNAFCFCNLITNFLILVALYTSGVVSHESKHTLSRKSFPPGFTFGSSSSAYQYEGAAFEGGKGPSIWDTFSHKHKEKIADGSNGDVAVDQYHRYQQDVKLMKSIGLDAYRFSISWPRILPTGSIKGGINKEGLNYYHNLIDSLVSRGLKPFVTLFHWDVPQALEDEYGGFLSPKIVEDYANFVDVCFREFGDKVKHWITLNEPLIFASFGYATGTLAPGRCSRLVGNCSAGDSGREPYVVGHNQLLAHAAAVKLYKGKYQDSQKGVIGITLLSNWVLPYGPTASDKDARQRAIDFTLGWYMDPLTRGMYPQSMRSLVKDRLPRFTKEEAQLVQGSFDFIGLNYYTTIYAIGVRPSNNMVPNYSTDSLVNSTSQRNGVPIGPRGASSWLYMYPQGLRDLLVYIKTKYNNPIIYITENGIDEFNNASLPLKEALKDPLRIEYHAGHLAYVLKALSNGVDVRGYFVWSFLDNYEWNSGYTVRFGINFVDYSNGLRRYPKKSALWFKSFLRR